MCVIVYTLTLSPNKPTRIGISPSDIYIALIFTIKCFDFFASNKKRATFFVPFGQIEIGAKKICRIAVQLLLTLLHGIKICPKTKNKLFEYKVIQFKL